MSSEAPKFRIPPEITEAVIDEADSYEETLEYAKLTMQKVRETHPTLYRYLEDTAKEQGEYWFSYGIASSVAFDIMSRQLAQAGVDLDITPEDISRHKSIADGVFNDPRWNDEQWVIERASTKDGVDADSGLGLFLNVVDAVAPEFSGYISDFTPQVTELVNRRHMMRGFYDGFMPFYTKMIRSREVSS
ncbi:MAG TPA: hypothetical protein VG917_02370 [Patescibacteria group bacterium]|nr:hypothetical protein [Patescibacteria group bacterium]